MAKTYSSKEVKSLIDKHRKNLKRIEASLSLPSEYRNQIQHCINNMFAADEFSKTVMDSLNGKETVDSIQFGELVRLLYIFKRATAQTNACKTIISSNKTRIEAEIKEASVGSNAVSWLFSTSKKKQNSEFAYEQLIKETDGSDYWEYSKKILSYIERNNSVSAEEGFDDFELNKEEYREILESNLPRNPKLSELIRSLNALINKFKVISSNLERETLKVNTVKEHIKAATDRMIAASALDILKSVPVEEVNKSKKGFRVKSLRDAGFSTMADLFTASVYQLASVHGISEDAAYSIKNIAKVFANEASRNAKIKLSTDNKTKESNELVSWLFKYRQYGNALTELNKLNADYGNDIDSAIAELQSVGSGIYWSFFDDGKKFSVRNSYSHLCREINGDYSNKSAEVIRMFKKADTYVQRDAWDDFKNNSIAYFNIIEEIVPGVLGNDDKLYGLPEDLAREIQDECFFPDGLNCELRRYQEWGVKYILHQERVLFGDEMGLGKTVQAIAAMVSLRNTGASHFIVVCPASVLPNWCKEISAKSKLRVTKVHGAGRVQAIKSWIQTGGVAVTTFEATGIFQFDEAFSFDLMVVDEAHFIKNPAAVRSRNVRKLAAYTKRLLFMTGTALENKVDEMISLIDVLQPNLAKSIRNIAFMSTAPQFREKIAGVYYRRKREDVLTELPDLIESREWCTMSAEETRLYEQSVLAKNFAEARRLSWNMEDLDHSCKAHRMAEIVNEAESEDRKVLIFSFFLDTIRKIHAYLGDRCCNPINGSISPNRRQEIIDEFNKDPSKTVLCAQIQSGGTGLNIQSASVVIFCEPQFKPSIENQAISRAYRMGQARNVLVYRLLCEDSVDERLIDMLAEKQAVFDAFADKSVAAANTEKKEIDETTFGRIIEEEIERIMAKGVCSSPKNTGMFKPPQQKGKIPSVEIADEPGFETKSALTSSAEYTEELSMSYLQLVNHLLKKYGKAKGDYFLRETCVSPNQKIKRAGEGLYIHHIDEDRAIMLSDPAYAQKNPFAYQKAERLVYCNILEHLILHIKIVEEPRNRNANFGERPGLGGAKIITGQINDYYGGYDIVKKDSLVAMGFIKDSFDDYIKILRYFWNIIKNDKSLSAEEERSQLTCGKNIGSVPKISGLI